VQKVSGCLECHVVTGEFDYFMLVRTRDNDSYNRLHAEQLLVPARRAADPDLHGAQAGDVDDAAAAVRRAPLIR